MNFPNFFYPETEILFQVPQAGHVILKFSTYVEKKFARYVDVQYKAGYHHILWDDKDKNGNPVSSGVYLYQVRAGNFSHVRKMSLLR